MNRPTLRLAALVAFSGLTAGLALGPIPVFAEVPGSKPKVGATIFPLYDIARQVAGPVADVVLILPPGASPHTFEPTPAAVRSLSGARTLFAIGHGLDDWAARLARGAGVPRLVRVDADIALRHETEGQRDSVDPHYWLSIRNGEAIARTVAAELERLVPDRAVDIRGALAAYLARLDATDREIRRRLDGLPTRRIATFHDAFGYFADVYGLEIAAVFEPYPGREPGPKFVVAFQQKVRATGVRVVFSEPQLSVDAIRPIARDLGVAISTLDPLGGTPGREGYIETMLFNAGQVAAALGGRAP
ncbi:MAG TPA: metal ABC transporter substrate-binding protein [Candidatus Nitrosotalea sp.]|nr:metal ABC transporter substrate-binding protein [Candidatus Nitrosotalea sp.]